MDFQFVVAPGKFISIKLCYFVLSPKDYISIMVSFDIENQMKNKLIIIIIIIINN